MYVRPHKVTRPACGGQRRPARGLSIVASNEAIGRRRDGHASLPRRGNGRCTCASVIWKTRADARGESVRRMKFSNASV